jgi:hypothetical protein
VIKVNQKKWNARGWRDVNVVLNWLGGDITSDAGLLLLREAENRLGLLSAVADTLVDKWHQSYTKHSLLNLLK